MTSPHLAHLYALRSHLDAVILEAEEALGIRPDEGSDPGACPQCKAPSEQVVQQNTLDGTKKRRCGVCGHEWTV